MREVSVPLWSLPWPYLFFRASRPGQRKLSVPQQRIVDTMRVGVWYQCDDERSESLAALIGKGWCVTARIARRGKDGTLYEPDAFELLFACMYGDALKGQPLVLYRRITADECAVLHSQ